MAVITVLLIAVALGTFTKLATYSPWSPMMDGWSGDPVPVEYLNGTIAAGAARRAGLPSEAMSQLPFHRRTPAAKRGPALDSVATSSPVTNWCGR